MDWEKLATPTPENIGVFEIERRRELADDIEYCLKRGRPWAVSLYEKRNEKLLIEFLTVLYASGIEMTEENYTNIGITAMQYFRETDA